MELGVLRCFLLSFCLTVEWTLEKKLEFVFISEQLNAYRVPRLAFEVIASGTQLGAILKRRNFPKNKKALFFMSFLIQMRVVPWHPRVNLNVKVLIKI